MAAAAAAPHVVPAAGSFVVVTQVISSPQGSGPNPPQDTKSRIQIQASVLGTLQILIRVVFLTVQLAIVSCSLTLGLFSGAIVWGPLSFVVSGSLTVSSGLGSSLCSVSSARHFALLSVFTSCAATVISALDAADVLHLRLHDDWCCDSFTCWSLTQKLSVVLAGFCLAEVITAVLSYSSSFQSRKQEQVITDLPPQEGAPERPGSLPTYEAPLSNANATEYEVLPADTPTYVTPIESPSDAPPPISSKMKSDEYNTYITNPAPYPVTPPPASSSANQNHGSETDSEAVNV